MRPRGGLTAPFLVVVALALGAPAHAPAARTAPRAPLIDAHVALDAFTALAEARLEAMSQLLALVAATPAAQGGDWTTIRPLLGELAELDLPVNAIWYARADGSYFTVEKGRTGMTLADRPYFPRLRAGKAVEGSLVISRTTGKRSVIVARPILREGRMRGAVGLSVSVDALSRDLGRQLGLPEDVVFYALDRRGQTALHRDPSLMFEYPSDLGDETLRAAVGRMLEQRAGTVRYQFRGHHRTVIFRRSTPLGWVFALGFETPPGRR